MIETLDILREGKKEKRMREKKDQKKTNTSTMHINKHS